MAFLDDHVTCGCCGWHASEKMLNEMSLRLTERAVLDYAGLERVLRTESNDAPFVPAEVSLTELLAENASAMADRVEEPIYEALSGTYVDETRITAAMVAAGAVWENDAWHAKLENNYRQVLSRTALLGANDVAFSPELGDVDRLRIVNGMSRSAKYYTNAYFNQQVMPAVVNAAHAAVLNGTANDGVELDAIRALLDRRLRSVPYWNLVANGAASRAYHFGYIKAGIAAGMRSLMFKAIIDNRTSDICMSLHGTTWHAPDVSILADRIADATADEIKSVAPWMKLSDIQDMDETQLLQAGVVIPPVHGRCRSQLVFV